jgi:hypothetical protein
MPKFSDILKVFFRIKSKITWVEDYPPNVKRAIIRLKGIRLSGS